MPEPVELTVGGRTYRVVASTGESSLRRLAGVVEQRLRQVTRPGQGISPHSLLLVALSLANELEEERERRTNVEQRSREMLRSVLERIDTALETADQIEASVSQPPHGEFPRPNLDP